VQNLDRILHSGQHPPHQNKTGRKNTAQPKHRAADALRPINPAKPLASPSRPLDHLPIQNQRLLPPAVTSDPPCLRLGLCGEIKSGLSDSLLAFYQRHISVISAVKNSSPRSPVRPQRVQIQNLISAFSKSQRCKNLHGPKPLTPPSRPQAHLPTQNQPLLRPALPSDPPCLRLGLCGEIKSGFLMPL